MLLARGRMVLRMTTQLIDHVGLERYLPHRGINILPDTLELDADEKTGLTHTTIHADDARGRLFLAAMMVLAI